MKVEYETQIKVRTGFWNLVAVERRPWNVVGVRYVPRYRHTWWSHTPNTGEKP